MAGIFLANSAFKLTDSARDENSLRNPDVMLSGDTALFSSSWSIATFIEVLIVLMLLGLMPR
uniref:Uncharacterized protein n=1 Tax=Hyaloperonospora arabidopsidis (strain Emoy2) TaxID=559515 RepID=M4BJ10_HYAAE